MHSPPQGLIALTRPGFEPEVAVELRRWADRIIARRDDCDVLYVLFENTTQGHALHNIPVLRQMLRDAGLAVGTDPAPQCKLDDWETMVDTNVKGLMFTTRLLLPRLIAHGRGATILNVGSVAGTYPYPGSNVYGGTKAFVGQFSLSLRCDLQGTGVRVTNIEPGLCESEFSLVRFGGDQARYDATYAGAEPIQPQDIAETIFWIMNQPAHININSLELMPVSQDWAGMSIDRSAKKD